MKNSLILALVLASAASCGDNWEGPTPPDAAPDARICREAWRRVYDECGPPPRHYTMQGGEDIASWVKEAEIWMGCAAWVQ